MHYFLFHSLLLKIVQPGEYTGLLYSREGGNSGRGGYYISIGQNWETLQACVFFVLSDEFRLVSQEIQISMQ